jgi:uncharacterized protein (DUF4213/DUF364 family)
LSTEQNRNNILAETMEGISSILGGEMESITIERAVVGLFFTGVKLSNGFGGMCFTPVKEIPEAVCCPSSLRAMPNSGKLAGHPAMEFIDNIGRGALPTAMGIAVLNALSEACWKKQAPEGYGFSYDLDPLENRTITEDLDVVVIGALVPYFRTLKKRERPFHILEKDPRTLKADEMKFFCPEEKAAECIAAADMLIITGTTLINNTLEGILSGMKSGAEAILVGPTASMLPGAFFRRGVKSIGGVCVTEPDSLLDTLAEAGSGYHFYGKSARKLVIESK